MSVLFAEFWTWDARTFPTKKRGDKGVQGFWDRGHMCIFDIRVTDTECRSTRNLEPVKALERHEKEKKKKR